MTDREAVGRHRRSWGRGWAETFKARPSHPARHTKSQRTHRQQLEACELRLCPSPPPGARAAAHTGRSPRPPPAVPPTGSPDSWTRLYSGTPAMPRSSRACTRTLLSLPFLGHSVIRFLNLEAALAPTGDPCPHPLAVADRPGSCGQATTWLRHPVPGGSLPAAGRVRHDPARLQHCPAT